MTPQTQKALQEYLEQRKDPVYSFRWVLEGYLLDILAWLFGGPR